MNIKQYQIINAYKTINEIKEKGQDYPLSITYVLFYLKKALQNQWDFQIEEEQKIFDKYVDAQDEEGRIKFKDEASAKEFSEKLKELSDMNIELECNRQKIKISERVQMSLAQMEALDPFVDFTQENPE